MTTLGDDYPLEQARCRELLGFYKEIGASGVFGARMIEAVLKRADKAAADQDVAAMVRVYAEMKECE